MLGFFLVYEWNVGLFIWYNMKNMLYNFEWNSKKEKINIRKHGVSFDEASTVFGDILSVTYPDPDHSIREERFVMIGLSSKQRIMVVSHLYHGETIRIISARSATKRERRFYEHRI